MRMPASICEGTDVHQNKLSIERLKCRQHIQQQMTQPGGGLLPPCNREFASANHKGLATQLASAVSSHTTCTTEAQPPDRANICCFHISAVAQQPHAKIAPQPPSSVSSQRRHALAPCTQQAERNTCCSCCSNCHRAAFAASASPNSGKIGNHQPCSISNAMPTQHKHYSVAEVLTTVGPTEAPASP